MIIRAKIRVRQPRFSVETKGSDWTICVKSPAEGNKANMEIIRELSKLYGSAKILRGMASSRKTIHVG